MQLKLALLSALRFKKSSLIKGFWGFGGFGGLEFFGFGNKNRIRNEEKSDQSNPKPQNLDWTFEFLNLERD